MLKLKIGICVLFIMLSGCIEIGFEKKQEKHIHQYYKNLSNIMKEFTHSVASSNKVQNTYEAHTKVLANLDKVQKHFNVFEKEEKLQVHITLFDSALRHLMIRQMQILELGQPVWDDNAAKYERIKKPQNYQRHNVLMLELLSMIEEYKDLFLEHHEIVRQQLVSTSLTKKEREEIWPLLNNQIATYLYYMKPQLKGIKNRVSAEIEIVEYLYEHKKDYIATTEYGLQFKDQWRLAAYQNKLRSLNRNIRL